MDWCIFRRVLSKASRQSNVSTKWHLTESFNPPIRGWWFLVLLTFVFIRESSTEQTRETPTRYICVLLPGRAQDTTHSQTPTRYIRVFVFFHQGTQYTTNSTYKHEQDLWPGIPVRRGFPNWHKCHCWPDKQTNRQTGINKGFLSQKDAQSQWEASEHKQTHRNRNRQKIEMSPQSSRGLEAESDGQNHICSAPSSLFYIWLAPPCMLQLFIADNASSSLQPCPWMHIFTHAALVNGTWRRIWSKFACSGIWEGGWSPHAASTAFLLWMDLKYTTKAPSLSLSFFRCITYSSHLITILYPNS